MAKIASSIDEVKGKVALASSEAIQARASAHVLRRTNICTAQRMHRIYYVRNHHRYWKCIR